MSRRTAVECLYPEQGAGGFTRFDHKVQFFSRVNSLIKPNSIILDFGAGRGEWAEGHNPYQVSLQDFQNNQRVQKVIGVDVDNAVLSNQHLDESYILIENELLSLEDESVDLIVSYAVFEHIENPEKVAAELRRVLKPDGWICAWTPNRYGYVAILSSLIPNFLHAKVLEWNGLVGEKDGQRGKEDVFPTRYRLNSLSAIQRYFSRNDFLNFSYIFSGPEGYAGSSMALAIIFKCYNWALPRNFGTHLYVFLRKK